MRLAPILALLLIAAPAGAERGELLVGARVGAAFADVVSRAGPSYVVGVDVAWVPPVWRRVLFVAVDGALSTPGADGGASDAALGAYRWHLDERTITVGASFGWRQRLGRFTPYAGVGPRLFVVETALAVSAAARLPAHQELSAAGGGGLVAGSGFRLGPGELFADLRLDAGALANVTTGDTVVGALCIAAGYRVSF